MDNPAPGFRDHPEHTIVLDSAPGIVTVRHGETVIARSERAVILNEDRYPPRAYVPRGDVRSALVPSERSTHCPFKGDTVYFHVDLEGGRLADAAWAYETPFDEMTAIAGLVSFDDRFSFDVERLHG